MITTSYSDLRRVLRWATAITAVLYAFVFFSKMTWSYLEWRAAHLDIDWTVPTNPQSMIALCFVTATLALWFLRENGEGLALVLFSIVVLFFGYWYSLTRGIKVNMNVATIPQAGPIGNIWMGASVLDVVALMLACGLLGLDLFLLIKARGKTKPVAGKGKLSPSHS